MGNKDNNTNKTSSSKHYLTGREIRAIAKANSKEMKRLEAYKNRKASEEEFISELNNPENILEIDDLHTYFFTEQGVVKAVNGVSIDVPKNSTKYIGVAKTKNSTAPSDPSQYTWSEYKDYVIYSETDAEGVTTVHID